MFGRIFFKSALSVQHMKNFERAISSSKSCLSRFEVKINQQNETFEFHDTEVDASTSEKQKKFEFPFVYLRDNCRCAECFHQHSKSRTIDWEKFDISIKPLSFQFDDNKLDVIWNDKENHKSVFPTNWLIDRNFTHENFQRYKKLIYRPQRHYWSALEFKDIVKYFDYRKVLTDDHELRDWLLALSTYGVAFLRNVPANQTEIRRLCDHVGFIRRTHYGEDFQITAKEGTVNVAYLSSLLQMHCDLPYYHYIPGVTLLHCLVQTKSNGAENTLVDAMRVAETMRVEYPADFEALSTILVNWNDIGREETGPAFHSIYRAPMICLDYENEIERVNHSIPQRDSFFTASIDDVKRWYKALAKFVELIHQEAVQFKTEEGTILSFDNTRLLHGRAKYEDMAGNRRHVVGAYLDWDEVYSRYRVLQNELKQQ